MSVKNYQLFCDNCNYKRFTDGTDVQDLCEIPTSPIPRGSPYIDPITKKTLSPPHIKQIKKFKCPKCGYAIKPRTVQFTEEEPNQENQPKLPGLIE